MIKFNNYKIIDSPKKLQKTIKSNLDSGATFFSFDFETTGLEFYDTKNVEITLLALTFYTGYSIIVPFNYFGNKKESKCIKVLKTLFENPKLTKVAHNAKFDMHLLKRIGIKINGIYEDTLLMHHLLDENDRHGLKYLSEKYFYQLKGYGKNINFKSKDIKHLAEYAAIDSDVTLRLYLIFLEELNKKENSSILNYYYNCTLPALKAIEKIEYNGCYIDTEAINNLQEVAEILKTKKFKELSSFKEIKQFLKDENKNKLTDLQESLELKIKNKKSALTLAGKSNTEIKSNRYINDWKKQLKNLKLGIVPAKEVQTIVNFNSPKQVQKLIYTYFKFKPKIDKFKKEKVYTTDRKHLKTIKHPFVNLLFAYRTLSKVLSTYCEGFKEKTFNGKIHTNFLIHGTVTHRLSSRNPNLQNIITRLDFKDDEVESVIKKIKTFFINKSDKYVLVQCDYSQAELRVIANKSKDKNMIDAYVKGLDLHAVTGSKLASQSLEDFYKNEEFKAIRQDAKSANFGLVYGISDSGYYDYVYAQRGIKLTDTEIKKHKNAVFKSYPSLKRWHKEQELKVKQKGFVYSFFGTKRRLPDIKSNVSFKYHAAIREAINAPIQGTAGQLTIFCMALLNYRLPKNCIMWSNVHDAIYFYVPKNKFKYCIEIINDTCENPPLHLFNISKKDFPVKMELDYSISNKNIRDMQEVGNYNELMNNKKILKQFNLK